MQACSVPSSRGDITSGIFFSFSCLAWKWVFSCSLFRRWIYIDLSLWTERPFFFKRFNSIQFFISFHFRAIQCVLFFKLSMPSLNCTYNLFVFSYIIHDIIFINMHALWKWGRNRLLAMLHPNECWCSVLYSIIILWSCHLA